MSLRRGTAILIAFFSILSVNQYPPLNINVIGSDTLWAFSSTQKWYRWSLWIGTAITLFNYWRVELTHSLKQTIEKRRIRKIKRLIEQSFIAAQDFLSQEQYTLAAHKYGNMLELLSTAKIDKTESISYKGNAYLGLGHALWGDNNKREALRDYNKAKEIGKTDDISLSRLSQDLFESQNFQAICQLFKTFNSQLVENRILLSRSYIKMGKAAQAIPILRQTCSEDMTSWKVPYYLGCAYGWQKDYRNAIKNFSIAQKLAPDQTLVYIQRGHAYYKIGQLDKAQQDYVHAQKLGDTSDDLKQALAVLLIHKKNYKNAEKILKSLKFSGTNQLLLGSVYEQQNFVQKAIETYESALQNYHNPTEIHQKIGLAYIKINQFEAARQNLDKVVQIGSVDGLVLYNLGWAYYKLNQFNPCISCWSKFSQLAPKKYEIKKQTTQVRCLLAQQYIQNENFEKIIAELTDYYELSENDESIVSSLAEIYFRAAYSTILKGNNPVSEKAIEYLNRGHKLVPEDTRFPYYLALLEINLGNMENAVALLQSLKTNYNHDSRVLYQLALCQTALDKITLAEQEFISLLQQEKIAEITEKTRLSFAVLKMRQGEWSEAADLLLTLT